MKKALIKYLPVLFCFLLVGSSGFCGDNVNDDAASAKHEETASSTHPGKGIQHAILTRHGAPGSEKRNVEFFIEENEVKVEDLISFKKHLDSRPAFFYSPFILLLDARGGSSTYGLNRYFPYDGSCRYLAFQVFRI